MRQTEGADPCIAGQHHVTACLELDPPVTGMPLFRRGTFENPVAGEGQTAAGQRIQQGRIRDIEGVADHADVLVERLCYVRLRYDGTDADDAVAELVHRGQAHIGEHIIADFDIVAFAGFKPVVRVPGNQNGGTGGCEIVLRDHNRLGRGDEDSSRAAASKAVLCAGERRGMGEIVQRQQFFRVHHFHDFIRDFFFKLETEHAGSLENMGLHLRGADLRHAAPLDKCHFIAGFRPVIETARLIVTVSAPEGVFINRFPGGHTASVYIDRIIHQPDEGAFGDRDLPGTARDVHAVVTSVGYQPSRRGIGHEMHLTVGQITAELSETAETAAGMDGDVFHGDVLALFRENTCVNPRIVPQNDYVAEIGLGTAGIIEAVDGIAEVLDLPGCEIVAGRTGDTAVVAVELDVAPASEGRPFSVSDVKFNPVVTETMRECVRVNAEINRVLIKSDDDAFRNEGLFPVDRKATERNIFAVIHRHGLHLSGKPEPRAVTFKDAVFHPLHPDTELSKLINNC